jgi:thymidylate synthase (FAD)
MEEEGDIPELGTQMRVWLVGRTQFTPPTDIGQWARKGESGQWASDASTDGEALIEMAGRACYESWSKPNPATSHNPDYIRHILDVGHLSVIEHALATFYIVGITRALTHELVRHRHFSYSQRSTRYVTESDANMLPPEVVAANPAARQAFDEAVDTAKAKYAEIREVLKDDPGITAMESKTARRKAIRQAARSVLPNATETRIVVTGNLRAWRHFVRMRATAGADPEIRGLALEILKQLKDAYPAVFADYEILLEEGLEVARSPLTWD